MSTPPAEPKTAVIIEDDAEIRRILAEVLAASGFSTVSVDNGIDGVQAVLTHRPLLTTIDVNMPGIDGIETAKRIRAQSDTLIIMLTGLNDEADVIAGLGAGADEYLLKPFRPRELRARVDALLRRTRPSGPEPAVPSPTASHPVVVDGDGDGDGEWLVHRDLRLNPDSRIALIGQDALELTRTEFDLLAALLESKRRVRSKADLTLVLRGDSYVTSSYVGDADRRAVEAHMTNLRRKLRESAARPRYIETVRGVGYRLTADTD
jgi:DNA-binding response OmpR family regulator